MNHRDLAPLAALNNYLLAAWMIVFGVVLVRWRESLESDGGQ